MKKYTRSIIGFIVFLAFSLHLDAQGTGFSYQGRVLADGTPLNGTVDMTFAMFSANTGGSPLSGTVTNRGITVTNGLFTTVIDFGPGVFTGASSGYWLQIGVKGSGDTNFGTLSPLQQLTPAPFAVTAESLTGVASYNTVLTGFSATVGGGYSNISASFSSTVGGGQYNTNYGAYSTISGGAGNLAIGPTSVIGGGANNNALGTYATVGGGAFNTSSNTADTVNGGVQNFVYGQYATIGGGYGNTNASDYGTIGGGNANFTSVSFATVAGGNQNVASNFNTTVSGGVGNKALLNNAAIGGGFNNTANGNAAAIPGGAFNLASGRGAIAAGGESNNATGDYSFAAGAYANAANNNSFVWSDGAGSFSSTANNQFSVRASGGITLAGDIAMAGGSVPYHHLSLSGGNSTGFIYGSYTNLGDGIHFGYNWYEDNSGVAHVINTGGGTSRLSARYGEIQFATGNVNTEPTVRLDITTTTVAVENATFNGNASDRNIKQDFADINPAEILDKVAHLPVSEWSYKFDTHSRHIGPMAQDFRATFNVGTDERHIAPVDEGGIALAAIQGLNQKLDEKDAEIRELKANVADLKKMVQTLAEKK